MKAEFTSHIPHTHTQTGTLTPIHNTHGIQCIYTIFTFLITPLSSRVRNLKFVTYLKFATGENTNKINELW